MSSFPPGQPPVESKRIVCGILGILLGGFAIHRFLLGDTMGGIIRIAITIVTCGMGGIIGPVMFYAPGDPKAQPTGVTPVQKVVEDMETIGGQ